jgi:hypothetical protein
MPHVGFIPAFAFVIWGLAAWPSLREKALEVQPVNILVKKD